MNKLEFNAVLEVLGIDNKVVCYSERNGTEIEVYGWNDLGIYGYSDYAILKGKIPLEVAQDIHDMFPNYGISYDAIGKEVGDEPIEWATNKEYENYVSILRKKGDSNIAEKAAAKRKEIMESDPDSLYIREYYVSSKEGLIILLSQIAEYLEKQEAVGKLKMLKKTKGFETILGEVNGKLAKYANLGMTSDEWLKLNGASRVEIGDDEQLWKIRELIGQLESAVNPFSTKRELCEKGSRFAPSIWGDAKGNSIMFFGNEKAEIVHKREQVCREYNTRCISSEVYYSHAEIQGVEIQPETFVGHYLLPELNQERVSIEKYDLNLKGARFELGLELGTGTVQDSAKSGLKATKKQKEIIIKELIKAVKVAKSVTNGIVQESTKVKENLVEKDG